MQFSQSSQLRNPRLSPLGTAYGLRDRFQLDHLIGSTQQEDEGLDVVRGLSHSPKSLPARYFYDDHGSELFEQICELPEYYLTRTETAILRQSATAIAQITGPCELVELGSGSSTKTRILIEAYRDQDYPLRYVPIDVSAGMLEASARRLLTDYASLHVRGLASTYEVGLENLGPSPLGSRMICFIGSSLGNLAPTACDRFLHQVRAALTPGEYFLLGLDLQKPKAVLEAAYNDRQRVTAAFNLNMLRHLNWRFEGDFDLNQFKHQAVYNDTLHQVEMYLHSQRDQVVTLKALDLQVPFRSGEAILSEISRKFDRVQMSQTLAAHQFQVRQIFTDAQDWFALFLAQAK